MNRAKWKYLIPLIATAFLSSHAASNPKPEDRLKLRNYKEIKVGDSKDKVLSLLGEPVGKKSDKYIDADILDFGYSINCYFDKAGNKVILVYCNFIGMGPDVVCDSRASNLVENLKEKYREDKSLTKVEKENLREFITMAIFGIDGEGREAFFKKDYEKALKLLKSNLKAENKEFSLFFGQPYQESLGMIAWIEGDKSWVYSDRKKLIADIVDALEKSDKEKLFRLQSPILKSGRSETDTIISGKFEMMNQVKEKLQITDIINKTEKSYIISTGWAVSDFAGDTSAVFTIEKSPVEGSWEWTGEKSCKPVAQKENMGSAAAPVAGQHTNEEIPDNACRHIKHSAP